MRSLRQFAIPILILAIGIFYLATLRSGQEWSDDFAMYIHHAKNIVEGIDYRDTGYLYDPINAVLGPRFYPAGYPLLLAPVYALFGLDLTPMKVETVLLFLVFLGVFSWTFQRRLSRLWLAAALATIGLNPVLWAYKDGVTSDIPFLLFTYLSLALIDWGDRPGFPERRRWPAAVLTGLAIGYAILIRTVGIILIPALLLIHYWRFRRLTLFPWIACLVVGLIWLAHSLAIPGDSGYTDQLIITWLTIRYNLVGYFQAFQAYWSNAYSPVLTLALVGLLGLAAALGVWKQVKQEITVYEVYTVAYLGAIILWRSHQGTRFLIPLVPLFIVYVYQGLSAIPWKSAIWKAARFSIPAAVLLSYAAAYTHVDFGPFPSGVERPASQQLFTYIREHSQVEDVFLFTRPRALALYTGRSASGYSTLEPEGYTLAWSERIGLDYAIVGPGDEYLRLLVKRYPERFGKVFTNADFSVYRYLGE